MRRYAAVLRPVRLVIDGLIRRASLCGNPSFFDLDLFPWVREIEPHWETVRGEFEPILEDRASIPNYQDLSIKEGLSDDDGWKIFGLVVEGRSMDDNCRRCPETLRLLERIPGLYSAVFSILGPGKRIPDHPGEFAGLLRYELGLIVPGRERACGLRVDGDARYWEEGRSLVWDQTKHHSAWNDAERDRVVLFVDFLRPISFPMVSLVAALLRHRPRIVIGPM